MRSPKLVGLLATTAALALALTACGGRAATTDAGAVPGITDTTVTIGSSFALSGPLGANGTASKGAALAYFETVNAAGGVMMSDGKQRKITFVYYDDAYTPAKAVQNYSKLVESDKVFSLFQTFGTATNLAIMKKANADGVPEAFVNAGDAVFSNDRTANPWTIGWQPTYASEGVAYGKYLASLGKPLTVAVLRQSDTLGDVYLHGLEEGVAGSQVTIAGVESYSPTDATVDSQITNLAATKADVLYLAAIPSVVGGAINHAFTLGWQPKVVIASVSSSISQVIAPAKLTGYPELYSASFVKRADDPLWANDPAVTTMTAQMKRYAADANPMISNAPYTYAAAAALVEALKGMKTISRQGLMDSLNALKVDDIDILLPGLGVDGTNRTAPPVNGITLQHFENGGWANLPAPGH
ncbi:ABC transporter substrate-binding protein [Pseudonocardia sp. GCM10023141]|uniref:ABC transporter substrate-binding protein n=1 Tax=Pseudonocardia sp. GCM10023141 TaxID=3252653 RepID=UPI00360C292B